MDEQNAQLEKKMESLEREGAFVAGLRRGVCETPPFGIVRHPDTCVNPEPQHEDSYNSGKKFGKLVGFAFDVAATVGLLYAADIILYHM